MRLIEIRIKNVNAQSFFEVSPHFFQVEAGQEVAKIAEIAQSMREHGERVAEAMWRVAGANEAQELTRKELLAAIEQAR